MESVIAWASIIVELAAGAGGLPRIVDYLKTELELEKQQALILSMVAAFVAGITISLANGVITENSFTPENILQSALTVWTASQVQYKRLKWKSQS